MEHVQTGLAADIAGLQPGDVILEANKNHINDAAALEKMLSDAKAGDVFLLYIFRAGAYTFLTLDIP